jgi:hypothetical protein
VLIIRTIKIIDTAPGICHSVSVTVSFADSPDVEHEVARNM